MVREQYEVRWKDYYQILQVHPQTEADVIAAAYRRLALKYHPDRNREPGAEERFKELNEANEVLSDEQRRARYDSIYQLRQNGRATGGDYQETGESYQRSRSYEEKSSESQGPQWYEEEQASQPPPHDSHYSYDT